jgi:integrase
MERWLEHVAKSRRPTTAYCYEGIVRRYVLPVIGHLAVSELRREHVDAVLTAAQDRLVASTSRLLRAVLGIALHRAERWEIAGARNVVRLTDPPRVEPREPRFLDAAEARRLLDAAAGDRLEVVYVLAIFCGLRRGEIQALRWSDVDLDKREVHVRNTLHEETSGFRLGEAKSMSARRSIVMPTTVAAALAAHRQRQISESWLPSRSGTEAGEQWGLVVTSATGKPLAKSTLRGNFRRMLRKAGLPVMRLHDLRHSCASLLLGDGVAAQTVASLLGHSEVKTTLNVYGHVSRSQTQDAATAMDRLLGHQHAVQQSLDLPEARS